jgi:DTW domain-containing protein
MSRSVVLAGTDRCPRCQLNARWCICPGLETAPAPLPIHVVMHRAEQWRPSSTGHLIQRVFPDTQIHLFDPGTDRTKPPGLPTDREQWVLHPVGEELPPAALDPARPAPAIVLIDGTWAQSGPMLRAVQEGARRIRLPMTGESRYWLRKQTAVGNFSTAEALAFLLAHLGLAAPAALLRHQLELRVFAGLLSRGHKDRALAYLATSPVTMRWPELAHRLLAPRKSL